MTDVNITDWIVTTQVEQIDHKATGRRLRSLRENNNLSLRDLGEWLELSAAYLSDLERGKRNWSKQLVRRFVLAVNQ